MPTCSFHQNRLVAHFTKTFSHMLPMQTTFLWIYPLVVMKLLKIVVYAIASSILTSAKCVLITLLQREHKFLSDLTWGLKMISKMCPSLHAHQPMCNPIYWYLVMSSLSASTNGTVPKYSGHVCVRWQSHTLCKNNSIAIGHLKWVFRTNEIWWRVWNDFRRSY